MSKLLRRLLPLAGALAWRNRAQIADWYRNRKSSTDDEPPQTRTQIAPIPDDDTLELSTKPKVADQS